MSKPESAAGGPTQSAPSPQKNSGGGAGAKIGCHASGCKSPDKRLNFCDEHFKQFKFGLIMKNGQPVSDYERKFEHYQKWLKAQKVA